MARKRTARRRRVASKRRSVRVGGSRRKSARRRTSRRRVLRGGMLDLVPHGDQSSGEIDKGESTDRSNVFTPEITPDTRNRKGNEIPSTGEKTNQYTQRYGYGVPMRESPPPAGTSTDSSANAAQAATIAGSLCAEADASDSQRKNARSNIIEYNKLNPNTPICDQVVEDNTGERMLIPSLIHHPNAHACAHSPPIRP